MTTRIDYGPDLADLDAALHLDPAGESEAPPRSRPYSPWSEWLDRAAMAALAGLLAAPGVQYAPDEAAEKAYRYARAMLRERSRPAAGEATDAAAVPPPFPF